MGQIYDKKQLADQIRAKVEELNELAETAPQLNIEIIYMVPNSCNSAKSHKLEVVIQETVKY